MTVQVDMMQRCTLCEEFFFVQDIEDEVCPDCKEFYKFNEYEDADPEPLNFHDYD